MGVQGLASVGLYVCVSTNISPKQEQFSKGQVRRWLRNKTDFISLCQFLLAMQALQEQLPFWKPDISDPHSAFVLVSLCWSVCTGQS